MAIFAVHLSGEDYQESADKIQKLFPDDNHCKLSKRTYLVRTDKDAGSLVDGIGFGTEDRLTGTVFKLNSAFGGYDNRDIWDWLDDTADGE